MGQSNFYSIDKTTKKIRVMLLGIFFFTFLTFLPQARASHALGAELTYTCLGNNDYRITYNFFRDCGGISMGSTVSLNYQSSCGSSSITLTRESIEDITQTCGTGTSECQGGSIPGVEKHVFRGTLNLPSNSCIYTISVSVNARNSVITTLNNPGSQSLYIEALIYNNASICNNSPVFLNPASASGCVGQVVNYNHGVTDPDGDQLVFSLGNCYEGPGNPVNYNAGYSGTSPLATSGGVSINPNTGAITFTPSFIQVGVLCVIVKEYRNNVQIGQVVRDIQFNIGNCGANSAPTASGPYLYNATPGQQLCFNINGSDPNAGDKVKMSTNNGISGGSFSPSLPTGFVTNPSTQFCWTPQLSDQNQTHFFTISVQDDNCPVAASNTFTYQVTVGAACNGPMASCKNKIVYLNSNGVATISTSDIDNNSTYDCGLASMVLNNNTFGCNNIGNNNTVTLTVTDDEGATSQCTATVTVVDNSKPVPNVTNLPTVTGQCSASVTPPTATDNCAGTIVGTTNSPTTYNTQGTYNITWTYNDGNGNSKTQVQTVIVDDTMKPVPTVSNLPTVTGQCSASVTPPKANDNCAGMIVGTTNSPTTYNAQGTFYITWSYNDGNGNIETQVQTVIVDDTTMPVPNVANLPTITGQCGASVTPPKANDNCAGMIVGTTNSPTTYNTQGTYNITWTYNDGNGNSKTQVQTVIVEDITKPEISCPTSPITVSNAAGQCGANVPFNVSATDNCGDVTVVCTIGGDNGGGSGNCATNNLNLSLTFDNYPQETSWMILQLPQEIMVASGGTYGSEPDGSTLNIPINLPDGEYLFLIKDSAGDGMCCTYGSGSYALSSNGQTFAQGGSFSSFEKTPFCVETPAPGGGPLTEVSSGDFFPVGTTTVTCTTTDAAGLTDVCTFDIIVNDTQAPWLTTPCPGNITLCGAQNVSWTPPAADDNCGVVASTNNYDPDDFFEVGTYNVVYTFYDAAGLSVSCSFTITINPVPQVTISQTNLPTWCQGIKVLTANVLNPQALTYPLTFAWSDGLGDSPTVIAPANGTYSVVVTDALGCSTEVSTTVNVDISTLLSAYTIISGKGLEMYESDVLGGGVGVKNANECVISQNSSILTFMRANAAGVTVDGSSFVNNFINANFNVTLPAFLSNPYNAFNNINVPANATVTLSGSNYGYVTVEAGATLIIANPQIFIKNLVTAKNATIIFNQPTEMRIRGKMSIGQSNTVNPDGYTSVIYASGEVSIGQGSVVTLNIYAPEGLNVSDSGASLTTYMTGMFISNDEVASDHHVIWNWNLNCSYLPTTGGNIPFAASPDQEVIETSNTTKEGLNVYPNPTSGVVNIDITDFLGQKVEYTVYDSFGKEVMRSTIDQLEIPTISLDMSSAQFANGMYQVSLKGNTEMKTARFVLSK